MESSEVLKVKSEAARELANKLFEGPCSSVINKVRCMEREENRKIGNRRSRIFSEYDHTRLCVSCASYWHVEMAAQDLHRLYCLSVRSEASKAAKAEA